MQEQEAFIFSGRALRTNLDVHVFSSSGNKHNTVLINNVI